MTEGDVGLLLDLYDVLPHQRERLLALAAQSHTPPSWRSYPPPVSEDFLSFMDVEAVAESIRQWEIGVVPGIVQTESYARHLVQSWRWVDANLTPREVEERVAIRMNRQSRLLPPRSAQIWLVLDESVLMRTVGNEVIMREQMVKLLDVSALPNVRLQVVPLAHGRGVTEESFTLLNLDKDNPMGQCLVYIDHNITNQFFLDEQRSIFFEKMFAILVGYALSEKASCELIARYARLGAS